MAAAARARGGTLPLSIDGNEPMPRILGSHALPPAAMRAAVRTKCTRPSCTLADAIWEVQNRIRHAGRLTNKKSIGSTLLVKGLEFNHAIIIHTEKMTRKDWYVALTRATKSTTILSPAERFKPER
jgi:hypothetical protein